MTLLEGPGRNEKPLNVNEKLERPRDPRDIENQRRTLEVIKLHLSNNGQKPNERFLEDIARMLDYHYGFEVGAPQTDFEKRLFSNVVALSMELLKAEPDTRVASQAMRNIEELFKIYSNVGK